VVFPDGPEIKHKTYSGNHALLKELPGLIHPFAMLCRTGMCYNLRRTDRGLNFSSPVGVL